MSAISEEPRSSQTPTAHTDSALASLRASPTFIPCSVVIAGIVALAATEGGYFPTTWYPAALAALALLAVTVIAIGRPRAVPWPVMAAVGLMAAYTAWTYLSIAWADQQGLAWDGANRTALYLLVFALFALWTLREGAGAALLGMLGLGVAAVGLVELLRVDAASDPAIFMVDARLAEPVGYINANVALWGLAAWPCVFFASRRGVLPPFRGLFLGSAGLLMTLALMGQSRSWLLALPLAAVVYVALVPGRMRAGASLLVVGVGVYAVSGSALAIHDQAGSTPLTQLVETAVSQTLLMAALLALVGAAWGWIDRETHLSAGQTRLLRGASATVAGAAVLTAVIVAFTFADPVSEASDRWNEFKHGGAAPTAGFGRLSSSQTNRYDFWVVAADLLGESPLRGIGVDNFQTEYLRRGTSGEQPRYAHSLQMGVLSQTGVVGAALLFGAMGFALIGALGGQRRRSPLNAGVRAAAIGTFAYWFLHASVDWLWEFPALGAAAFATLGIAVATGRPTTTSKPVGSGRGRFAMALLAVPAVALGASLAFPWLSQLELERASDDWRANPRAAFARLDRASELNPASPTPSLTAGTIALALGDLGEARQRFRHALERDPENFYAVLELGAIAADQGHRERGLTLLRRASRLSPLNDVVDDAIERVEAGDSVGLEMLNRDILVRARQRAR